MLRTLRFSQLRFRRDVPPCGGMCAALIFRRFNVPAARRRPTFRRWITPGYDPGRDSFFYFFFLFFTPPLRRKDFSFSFFSCGNLPIVPAIARIYLRQSNSVPIMVRQCSSTPFVLFELSLYLLTTDTCSRQDDCAQ